MSETKMTEREAEQVARMCKFMRTAETKDQLSDIAVLYILDPEYERSAVAKALHDVEIEKGWH